MLRRNNAPGLTLLEPRQLAINARAAAVFSLIYRDFAPLVHDVARHVQAWLANARPVHQNSMPPTATPPELECDLSRRFVRVLREGEDGLVAFEFSIGWPDLAVELAMPRPMFEEFCHRQRVERLALDAGSPTLGEIVAREGKDE